MDYSLMTWIKRFGGVSLLAATVAFSPAMAMAAHHEEAEASDAAEAAPAEAAPAEEAPAALTGEVDLSGSWTMKIETPDGAELEGGLTFVEADGAVSALMVTDLGEVAIEDVQIEGNSIEFAADVDMGGVLMPISFSGSIGGDAIQGQLSVEMEGAEPMNLPTHGSRDAEPGLTGDVDLPGSWALDVELPDGSVSESALTVTEEEGVLVALIETELGEARIEGISVNGNAVAFETSLDMGGVLIPLSFEGTSGGAELAGVVRMDFEGQAMELPISGTKEGAGDLTGPVNLLGTWDVEAELPDGSVSSSAMTVVEENGALVALLETEIGEARVDEIVIDGNSISYTASIDMGGVLIPLTFTGSTGGDEIKGMLSLDMDGQKMELPVSGMRAAEMVAEEASTEETASAE